MTFGSGARGTLLVGAPRSGTTLAQQLLGGHPQVWTLPETRFFVFMLRRDHRWLLERVFVPAKRFNTWVQFARSHSILDVGPDIPAPRNAEEAVGLFKNLLGDALEGTGCSMWLEKTPGHVHYLKAIHRYAPELSVIHMLRAPSDTAASIVHAARSYPARWGQYDAIDQACHLVESALNETFRWFGVPNHHFVFFEDLISSTRRTLEETCAFLGLPIDEEIAGAMLRNVGDVSTIRVDEIWKRHYADSVNPPVDRLGALTDFERTQIQKSLSAASQRLTALRDNQWHGDR